MTSVQLKLLKGFTYDLLSIFIYLSCLDCFAIVFYQIIISRLYEFLFLTLNEQQLAVF